MRGFGEAEGRLSACRARWLLVLQVDWDLSSCLVLNLRTMGQSAAALRCPETAAVPEQTTRSRHLLTCTLHFRAAAALQGGAPARAATWAADIQQRRTLHQLQGSVEAEGCQVLPACLLLHAGCIVERSLACHGSLAPL